MLDRADATSTRDLDNVLTDSRIRTILNNPVPPPTFVDRGRLKRTVPCVRNAVNIFTEFVAISLRRSQGERQQPPWSFG
jgi:hypothetical protein